MCFVFDFNDEAEETFSCFVGAQCKIRFGEHLFCFEDVDIKLRLPIIIYMYTFILFLWVMLLLCTECS